MSDDQSAHEHALTDANGPGWPGAESGATDPGQGPKGSPMAGTTAQDEAAGSAADGDAAAKPPEKSRSFWRELPILIVVALVIALVIKSFVVQAFYIPSSSMENTLDIGDKVLVNKLVYHFRSIKPGDIIVFNPPGAAASDPTQVPFIKRIIGLPGDRIDFRNGEVFVNGVPQREGADYQAKGRTLMFERELRKDRISKRRWLLGAWGVGTYKQDDSIDVRYEALDGSPRVAEALEIEGA